MRREDVRATLTIQAGLVAATVTGFLREATLAYQLGAGRATDVYLIAFTLPEFVFTALPIVLIPAVIPLFIQARSCAGEAAAWRFARRAAGAVVGVLLALTLLVALGVPLYVGWIAPGFGALEQAQAGRALRWMLPALALMGAATVAGAVLQVYRRFARPALATAVYNLTFAATLVALPLSWAVGRAAWGVTLGAAAALLFQLPLLWSRRPRQREGEGGGEARAEVGRPPPGMADLLRLAGPLAAGYAVHHAIYFVDRAMATTAGPGSVATLNYAYRLALVVGQLSGLAVSTAVFPRMAEDAARNDLGGLRGSLWAALRFVWAVGLPACGALIVLRQPLVELLFERGAFDPAATAAVSGALPWYAVAVLADALCQPLWRVVYARRRAGTVVAVNALQTGVRIGCNLALLPALGYNGLALSAAAGLSLQAVVLAVLAHRSLGAYLPRGWPRPVLEVTAATAAALAATAWVAGRLEGAPVWAELVAGGAACGLVYAGARRLLSPSPSPRGRGRGLE